MRFFQAPPFFFFSFCEFRSKNIDIEALMWLYIYIYIRCIEWWCFHLWQRNTRCWHVPLRNHYRILTISWSRRWKNLGFLVDPWRGDSRPVTVKDGEENEQIIPASEVGSWRWRWSGKWMEVLGWDPWTIQIDSSFFLDLILWYIWEEKCTCNKYLVFAIS